MDDEIQEALELSKDDLLRMASTANPARIAKKMPRRVRRKQDLNQRATAIAAEATEREFAGAVTLAWEPETVVFTRSRFERSEMRLDSEAPLTVKG